MGLSRIEILHVEFLSSFESCLQRLVWLLGLMLLSVIGNSTVLQAQDDAYPVRVYNSDAGLKNNFNSISRDSSGFMWVQYDKGLQRFDGRNTRNFFLDESVRSLSIDGGGVLWVALRNGVFRYQRQTNEFELIWEPKQDQRFVMLSREGLYPSLIAGSDVIHIEMEEGGFRFHAEPISNSPVLRTELTSSFEQELFYYSHDTLWRQNLDNSQIDFVVNPQSLNVHAVSENEVFFSNWENKTWFYNFETKEKKQVALSPDDPVMIVFDVLEADQGIYFLATIRGLYLYDAKKEVCHEVKLENNGQAHFVQQVNSIARGENNRIWFCTENAMLYFNYSDSYFNYTRIVEANDSEGYSSDIRGFAKDGQGHIWLATTVGLLKCNQNLELISAILPQDGATDYLNHSSIRGLAFDGKHLVIGQTNKGIWIFNPETTQFRRPDYSDNNELKQKSEKDFINQIYQLQNGDYLVLAHQSLYLLKKDSYELSDLDFLGIEGKAVFANQMLDGSIYIGDTRHLYQLDSDLNLLKILDVDGNANTYTSLVELENSYIVGTVRGAYSLSKDSLMFSPVAKALESFRINTVFTDTLGMVWLVGVSDIYRFNPSTESLDFFGVPDNIHCDYFHTNSFFKNDAGKVFVGGTNGVNSFYPARIAKVAASLRPTIGAFKVPEFSAATLSNQTFYDFKHDQNHIELSIETPYYGSSNDLTYWYQLTQKGDWYDNGNNTGLTLWNLPPGSYQLKVATSFKTGNRFVSDASFAFEITPPFWKRTWFIGLIALVLITTVYLIYVRFQRRLTTERLLNKFATSLFGQSSVDAILWDTARNCVQVLGFVDSVIYQIDKPRKVLVQKAAFGVKNPVGKQILNLIEIPLGEGVSGNVALSGKAEIIRNTRKDNRYVPDINPALSEIAVPILVDGEVFAVIDSEHPRKAFYNRFHLNLLKKIADICGRRITKYLTEENLRTRIARDLHDEMGSNLTSIHIMSRLAADDKLGGQPAHDQFQKINGHISGIMENLNDMVWTVNPENDNFDKLMFRIKEYAASALETAGMGLRFEELNAGWKFKMNAEERKNIYLIAKEAINNAIKHSAATMVKVTFDLNESVLEMSILDNGTGFNIDTVRKGNGLSNMQNRAVDIGGTLEFVLDDSQGAKLFFTMPIDLASEIDVNQKKQN